MSESKKFRGGRRVPGENDSLARNSDTGHFPKTQSILSRQQIRAIGRSRINREISERFIGPRKQRRKLLKRFNKQAWQERYADLTKQVNV